LKEDSNRWYILGKLKNKSRITTFAIDRILSLQLTDQYFSFDDYNFNEYFKYSFGITVSDTPPIEVILSFEPHQGDYIKSLPIHQTQKILLDNRKELRISLTVNPTYEFYSKILSFGSSVKVLSPKEVIDEIRKEINILKKKYK